MVAAAKLTCELCTAPAAVHCPSDSAFLCSRCDAAVHSANFLVARHLRSPLCRLCGLAPRRHLAGSCDRCSPASSLTESSAAARPEEQEASSAPRRRRRALDGRREGILVNWCRRLALDRGLADSVVATAERVLQRLARAPVRVGLATSFWVGLRLCGLATCQNLVRVEKMTGVAAKVILAVEERVGRVAVTRIARQCDDYEEGWAES